MEKKIGEIQVENNKIEAKKDHEILTMENTANNTTEQKQVKPISKSNNTSNNNKGVEVRTINMQKQIKVNKSGEFILNHLYKHKKSINQIRKEEVSKVTEEPSTNKIEQGDINIGEEECFNELNELINSSKENKKGKKSSKKIKRCKNPLEAELEMMQESYVDELIQGLHDFCKINSGDEDEK